MSLVMSRVTPSQTLRPFSGNETNGHSHCPLLSPSEPQVVHFVLAYSKVAVEIVELDEDQQSA